MTRAHAQLKPIEASSDELDENPNLIFEVSISLMSVINQIQLTTAILLAIKQSQVVGRVSRELSSVTLVYASVINANEFTMDAVYMSDH